MKAFILSALAGLVLSGAIPYENNGLVRRDGGTCTGGAWVPPQIVPDASNLGNPFCETGWGTDYKPITNLTVWSVANYVKGMQATYADGSLSPIIGQTTTYQKQSIGVNYALGETWSAVYLFGDHRASLQHLTLRNSRGDKLNAGEPVADGLTSHAIDVGAGILMGFEGRADNIINALGFLFLASPIKTIQVTNFKFPNGPFGTQGINPENLAGAHYYNGGSRDETWTFTNSRQRTVTRTFQQTSTTAFQVQLNFQISGSIPILGTIGVQAQNNYQWTYTDQYQTTVAVANQVTVSWMSSGTIGPNQGVDCVAITGTAAGSFDYTSDVKITLQNGQSYSFSEAGSLSLSDTSADAVVLVTDDDSA